MFFLGFHSGSSFAHEGQGEQNFYLTDVQPSISTDLDDIGDSNPNDDYSQNERDLWPEAETSSNEDALESEIALDQNELRESFGSVTNKGMAFGFGATRPWLFANLSGYFIGDSNSMWEVSVGQGQHKFSGRKDDRFFDMVAKSKAVDFTRHWFLINAVPITGNFGVGFVSWNGDIDPSGTDVSEELRLQSGFAATGIYAFSGIGVNVFWSNGVYLEYNVVGFGISRVLDKTFTRDVPVARTVIIQNLQTAQSYGFTNLKVGWFY